MATGENFTRVHGQRSEAMKPRLKVDKKIEQRIHTEIRKLQDEVTALYMNDNLSEEEIKVLENPIDEKINQLIDSMYESKEEVKRRLYN